MREKFLNELADLLDKHKVKLEIEVLSGDYQETPNVEIGISNKDYWHLLDTEKCSSAVITSSELRQLAKQ